MTTFDIYIAFVSWSGGGKNRPVLILEATTRNVTAFSITSRYDNKSKEIRDNYFLISDWELAGLDKQSYVDTNATVTLPRTAIRHQIGKLSESDKQKLIEFIDRD